MSEVIPVLQILFQITSFVLVVLLVPLIKFLFDLRLKIERIETLLSVIIKDIEKLKEELYDGDSKN
jgi:sensor histidine kinase YesM